MSMQPFTPQGNTVAITVTAASSTAVQVPNVQGSGLGSGNYLLTNIGTQTVHMAFTAARQSDQSLTTAGTAVAAVIPVPGTPANGVPLLAGTSQTMTLPPGAWITTIAAAVGSTLYITPGDGQ